jgi:hypothetical protein
VTLASGFVGECGQVYEDQVGDLCVDCLAVLRAHRNPRRGDPSRRRAFDGDECGAVKNSTMTLTRSSCLTTDIRRRPDRSS